MILTCPNCATRYLVSPAKLRPGGRTVRCARCGESWFEDAPPPEMEDAPETISPPPEPEQAPEQAPSDQIPSDQDEEESGAASDRDGPPVRPKRTVETSRGRNLPALPRVPNRWSKAAGWIGLVLFVVLIISCILLFRGPITEAWPPAERLYHFMSPDMRGIEAEPQRPPLEERLQFSELKPSQKFVGGVLTLMIEGKINNTGGLVETLPPVEVVLLDDRQLDLVTWLVDPPRTVLEPGQSVTFETSLENPPPEAQDIRVTFAVRKGT